MQRLETIGRYIPREPLGAGGFATVYRAYDPVLDRQVALKVLHPYLARDPDVATRFVREGRALARVRHPNIVQVHDAGGEAGTAWIAMELIEGRTLDQVVRTGGPLPLATLAVIVQQIAAALTAVHGRGLVHRDVKPDNILLEAGTGRAVLLDLGLARMADSRHGSVLGMLVGTPAYMAPEQVIAGGQVSPRTDVYQLAATVYFLLAGAPPFSGSTAQVLSQITTRMPAGLAGLRPELPPPAREALTAALAKDAAQRPATPAELASVLASACAGRVSVESALPFPPPTEPAPEWAVTRRITLEPAPERGRSRRLFAGATVAIACLAAALGAGVLFGRSAGADSDRADVPAPAVTALPTVAATPTATATPSPSPTLTPTPATPVRTGTPDPPTRDPGSDIAAALLRAEMVRRGLTPSGPMVQAPAQGGTLYAQAGACINRDPARCQTVLFLLDRRIVGSDTPQPVNTVRSIRAVGQGQIAVAYAGYARSDPACCPSQPDVTVTFTWNGSRLISSGQPPTSG